MRRERSLCAFGERGYTFGEHPDLEHDNERLDGLPFDTTFARDVCDVQLGAVGEADRLEESREVTDVPDEALSLHFFAEIERDIGAEFSGEEGNNRRTDSTMEAIMELACPFCQRTCPVLSLDRQVRSRRGHRDLPHSAHRAYTRRNTPTP